MWIFYSYTSDHECKKADWEFGVWSQNWGCYRSVKYQRSTVTFKIIKFRGSRLNSRRDLVSSVVASRPRQNEKHGLKTSNFSTARKLSARKVSVIVFWDGKGMYWIAMNLQLKKTSPLHAIHTGKSQNFQISYSSFIMYALRNFQ